MAMEELLAQWAALVGIAALISVLINVLKLAGVVKDGDAPTWSAGLNLAGLVGLLLLKIFRPEIDLAAIDRQAAALAEVSIVLIGYITQLLSSKLTHLAIKQVPVIGASYSVNKNRAGVIRDQMIKRSYR